MNNSCLRLTLPVLLLLTMLLGAGCSKTRLDPVPNTPVSTSSGYGDSGIDYSSIDGDISGQEIYSQDGWTQAEKQAAAVITGSVVYFAFDSYSISPEGLEVLQQKAQVLKAFPQIHAIIAGHCDERGTEEYNLALGERRAKAAFDYLVQIGVNPAQLEVISYGKLNPAVSGSGEAVWAKNRRDEFKVTKSY